MALLAAPAVASADDGTSSAGSSSAKPAESSRGTAGAARTHTNAAKPAKTTGSATGPSGKRTTSSAVTPATQADFPAGITAPVTQKGIISEALDWAGFKDLGSKLPVPDAPVADLAAAAWVGVRRFHYTYFNSRPTLKPTAYAQDPNTGVITGKLGGYDADGDVLTYKIATAPKHGTLTVADDGSYTYTPDAAYAHAGGTDKFSFTVEDTSENPWHTHILGRFLDDITAGLARHGLTDPPTSSSTSIVAVAIASVNHAPTVTTTAGAADSETGTRIITATAGDQDSDPVTLAVTTGPAHGALTELSADEKTVLGLASNTIAYRYTPGTAYAHTGGDDSVTFTATDSRGASTTAPLTLATASINHVPAITVTTSAALADGSRLITATTGDTDSDPVTVTATAPSHGTLTELTADEKTALGLTTSAPAFRYTPTAAFAHTGGTETLILSATDSYGATATTTTNLTVAPINHVPTVAVDRTTTSTDPNTGAQVLVVAADDPDGDPVTITATTPAHGTLTELTTSEKATLGLTPSVAAYRYTPTTAYAHTGGTETLTLTVTDSYGATATTTTNLTVAPINHAPTVTLAVSGSDPNTGTVKITPTISDTDGDTVTLTVTAPPANGTVTANADGTYTFTPSADLTHTGITTPVYVTATDSYGATAQATATVVVTPINHAPSVTVNTSAALADGGRIITATTTDPDRDPVTVTVTVAPNHGTLVVLTTADKAMLNIPSTTAAYRYTPETTFAHIGGTDTVTFGAQDSYGATATTQLNITVAPVNHAPTVTLAVGSSDPNTGAVKITPTISDPDGDTVTLSVTAPPANGTVTANADGTYTFTPSADLTHTGITTPVYVTATDSYGASSQAIATVVVAPTNHAPNLVLSTLVVGADSTGGGRIIIATTTDPDHDPVTVALTGAPSHGTLTQLTTAEKAALGITSTAEVYRYAPDTSFAHAGGTETITFTATDPWGAGSQTVVTITVAPVNHAPVVTATVGGAQGQTGSRIIIATAGDPDGDPVTVAVTTSPSHGTLIALGSDEKIAMGLDPSVAAYRYTPATDFAHIGGSETIAFGATDSLGAGGATVVTFTVDPINNAPTAGVTVNGADAGTGEVTGTVAGSDTDGDGLTYTVSLGPIRGTVTIDPTTGQFSYTPSDEARAAAEGIGHTFTGTGWVTGSNFNSVISSFPANQTLSQYVVFDSDMQQGGTFNLSVNAHAGGGNGGNFDTANVRLDFYQADGTVVTSARSFYNRNLSQASGTVPWTTIGLSYDLSAADAAQTAYVKVSLIGSDGDYWAGNYGPQWAVPTLTFNGGPTNILYNPEFGQVAQGWTGNVAACGSQSASQACVTDSGVGANAGGGGYDANGGTVNGHAGGYSGALSAAQLLTIVNNGGTLPAELSDSFEVTVTDGDGGSATVVVDVPVTASSTAAGPASSTPAVKK